MSFNRLVIEHTKEKPHFKVLAGTIVFCQACQKSIITRQYAVKSHLTSHEKSLSHRENLALWKKKQLHQLSLSDLNGKSNNVFFQDVNHLFLKLKLPFTKMNHSSWKDSCEKYCHRTPPDESTCRVHYLKIEYDKEMALTRELFANKCVYLQVDEAQFYNR